jgi:predicted GIY-YIG superfamily endonuclease
VWFVYVLRCADGSFYVGEAGDLERRLAAHNSGTAAAHTARRRPVQLVYAEEHANRALALERERQIKGWTREKKAALITGDAAALERLSRAAPAARKGFKEEIDAEG